MIKQFRPPTRLAAWSGAGLCVCIGLATLTNAQEVKPKAAQAAESNDGTYTPRKAAEELAQKGRYDDAMELLDRAMKKLDKGSVEGELAYQELAALYESYRGVVLSFPASKNATPAEGSDPESAAREGLGDIVCDPSDIYGYTATNGGTMIAAQLTNTGPQEVTVDVEFWEGGIDRGTKIGRGGLLIPPAKTATEAIPWVVKNGQHEITVRIDPDNTVAESDEENNRTLAGIEYTNGRFQPLELLISQNTVETRHVKGFAEEEQGSDPIASVAPTTMLSNPKEDEQSSPPVALTYPTTTVNKPKPDRVAAGIAGKSTEILLNDAQLRAVCQNNLKQLGLIFKMFANESKSDVFPHLSRDPGRLMFAWEGDGHALEGDEVLSAVFLSDLSVVGCPGSGPAADLPDDTDFAYLGYVMRNDADVRKFAEAYEPWAASDGSNGPWFADDKPRSPDEGPTRLREGIERFLITDISNPAGAALAQSKIPTIIEWPDRHTVSDGKQGGSVLFMDGHVEFMTYPGKWPMTEETIGILCKLARREPIKKLE